MAVKQNDIRIGSRDNPFLTLNNSDIISVGGNLACDLLCEEIPIDTLEIQCRYDRMHRVFAPSDYDGIQSADGLSFRSRESAAGSVLDIPYATGLWYFNDDQYIGKFYVSDARRTGKNVYTITAVSAMGVLDGLTYYGKLFLNQPLPDVLNDIILTDGLRDTNTPFLTALSESIVLSDGLDAVKISGWIPSCTKREALHHVLFAQGLNLFKAENDAFLISRVSASTVGGIDPKNVYDSGSVDLIDRVKVIEVTEHAFVPNPNVEEVILYDNTEAAVDMEATVSFDAAPIMVDTITATGTIKIKQKNENCAVVSGVGTLTGKPYSHTSRTISRTNNSVIDGETITVSDATLVNSLNSNAVADRLFSYYTQRKQMQLPIVLHGERCGLKYGCVSPYGDAVDAYIAAMTINASAIAKADCRMISGYVPPKGSGEFSHCVLLTGSGTFTVPEEVLNSDNPRISVVLIGGGDGGDSGAGGQLGPYGSVKYRSELAKPGKAGKSGKSGRVYRTIIEGEQLWSQYSYKCGLGGKGGTYEPQITTDYDTMSAPGGTGEDSLFGDYTSKSGTVAESGYLDLHSGNIFAGPAPDFSHVLSGRGGGFCTDDDILLIMHSVNRINAENGEYVTNNEISIMDGGKIGEIHYGRSGMLGSGVLIENSEMYFLRAEGGAGGGGPFLPTFSPGYLDGGPSYVSGNTLYLGHGGHGADGADAPYPMDIYPNAYGMGGIGGMGGGGGGSAGVLDGNYDCPYTVVSGFPGDGGWGGRGSDGAPGCILVYY